MPQVLCSGVHIVDVAFAYVQRTNYCVTFTEYN